MASRRSSSSPSRGRRGRSSSSSNSSQMPMVLGGVGALVLIVLFVVMSSSNVDAKDDEPTTQPEKPAAKAPHVPKTNLAVGSAMAGKTPDRPAPPLSMDLLEQARALLQEAKVLNNEGVKLRTAGENRAARAVNSKAKVKIDQIKKLIDVPSTWQEEADMGDWAQPAEYVTLGKLWAEIANIENRVRKGGGTR